MGVFLETAVIPAAAEDAVQTALQTLEGQYPDLDVAECQVKEQNGGVCVLFNEYANGYEQMAKDLSDQLKGVVLYLYLYDDDFWGYFLCENGELVDEFNPIPDYFEEVSQEERRRVAGNSALVAERFHVPAAEIQGYLVPWTEEILESAEPGKAYESDEFGQGDCWQMADFMAKLGFPYEWS